jgi:hypothetical protein
MIAPKKKSFTAIVHEGIDNGTIKVNPWSSENDQCRKDLAFEISFNHPSTHQNS